MCACRKMLRTKGHQYLLTQHSVRFHSHFLISIFHLQIFTAKTAGITYGFTWMLPMLVTIWFAHRIARLLMDSKMPTRSASIYINA
uniref:Uncharacterized protein n=1 Tax=Parascaris equorum TaxID=6256 RepID=A0A914RT09_PAREQ